MAILPLRFLRTSLTIPAPDLLRTYVTNLAELGVAPHVIERSLNHVSGTISGVAAVYNRYTYLQEMRAAIALWETRLHSIIDAERLAA
jgi:hypothetical protein